MKARVILILSRCARSCRRPRMSQALTSLASVRVGYITRKNTVKPQGELKAQIDALDAQIAEASRLGRNGELRRLFAKGITLLAGRPWTDAADYSGSLVLRTARVVVDSIEAVHGPARTDLRAGDRAAARPSPRASGWPTRRAPAPNQRAADAGGRERPRHRSTASRAICASRRSSSTSICSDVPDGAYFLGVEVVDENTSLGRTALPIARAQGRGRPRRAPRGRRGARTRSPARGNPVPRRSHAEREPRPAGAAHVRSGPGFRGGRSGRGGGEGGQGSVRGPHRRHQAPLPPRRRERNHPVPDLRADRPTRARRRFR